AQGTQTTPSGAYPAGDPWEKARVLTEHPHSFAFASGAVPKDSLQIAVPSPMRTAPRMISSVTLAPKTGRAARAKEWLRLLESDLGVKVIEELPDAGELEASDAEEELVADVRGRPCFFHKGPGELRPKAVMTTSTATMPRHVRRPGPWRILEIFTVTMAGKPVNQKLLLGGISTVPLARRRRCGTDPDFLVVSWPSWARLPSQTVEPKNQEHWTREAAELKEQRRMLAWLQDLIHYHRKRGGAVLGEHPSSSKAWLEPLVMDAWSGLPSCQTEMCAFGLATEVAQVTPVAANPNTIQGRSVAQPGPPVVSASTGEIFVNSPIVPEKFLHEPPVAAGAFDSEDGDDVAMEQEHDAVNETAELAGDPSGLDDGGKLERLMLVEPIMQDDMIQMAEKLDCPVCRLGSRPRRPFAAKAESRAVSFGTSVHIHLKYEHDFSGQTFVCLSAVDEATTFHVARLLRNPNPDHVAKKFLNGWIAQYGVPKNITMDQGGEFETEFIALLENHAIHSKVAGSHAEWQNSLAERHGSLLGAAWRAIIAEHQCTGRAEMKMALSCAAQAKNAVISRSGHSAHMLVFGRQACFPDLLDDDVWTSASLEQALSIDSELARLAEMRSAAKVALLSGRRSRVLDVGVDRALSWCLMDTNATLYPGGRASYFWPRQTSKELVRRQRQTSSQLRWKEMQAEMEKGLIDLADEPEPPADIEATGTGRKMTEARKMMQGLKSVKRTFGLPFRKDKARRLLGKRAQREPPQGAGPPPRDDSEQPEQPLSLGASEREGQSVVDDLPHRDEAEQPEQPPPLGPRVDDVQDQSREAPPGHLQDLWDQAPPAARDPAYDYLDDVPFCLKRKLNPGGAGEASQEVSTKRLHTNDMVNFVLTSVSGIELGVLSPEAALNNEWLKKGEIQQLSELLDIPLTSARLHRDPQQVLRAEEKPEDVAKRPEEGPPSSPSEQGEGAEPRSCPRCLAFADVRDNILSSHAFLLKMKANGKELDPRFFDETERRAFDKSDQKEWQAWLDNHVIEQLGPDAARKVPQARIFKVPARVVRTNKAAAGCKDLLAKSRLVLPGHMDPDVLQGGLRKERGSRPLLYCRPPRDLSGMGAVVLWRILKSAYGLAEAPRLWYMQAKDLLTKCGFIEVPFAPATFVKLRTEKGQAITVAILCLCVDDGFLAVEDGREALETQKVIDNHFSIKECMD
ncbi:unnamed protein product, partial [Symbiodinium sp. KB8]